MCSSASDDMEKEAWESLMCRPVSGAKCQVEFLPEKCSHAGPLCPPLSLSLPSCGSAAFSLLFGADAAAMCCYSGRRKTEHATHIHTPLAQIQQESTWKQNPEAAYCLSLFPWAFFSMAGVPRDRGRERKGRERDREGGETLTIGK